MFRFITFTLLVLSIVVGIILNITAAINSGKNFIELATMNDLGVVFLVWGQYPLVAGIILALVLTSGVALVATKK